jgi:hypothetical protein
MNRMNETEKNQMEVMETDLEQVTGGGYVWDFMKKGNQAVKDRLAELGFECTDTSEDIRPINKYTQK